MTPAELQQRLAEQARQLRALQVERAILAAKVAVLEKQPGARATLTPTLPPELPASRRRASQVRFIVGPQSSCDCVLPAGVDVWHDKCCAVAVLC